MWILPSLLANIAALSLEWVYRVHLFPTWIAGWWLMVPLALVIQIGLYHSYGGAPSLLVAWSVFFFVNVIGRLAISTAILHESFTGWTGLGLMAIVLGTVLLRK